MSALDNMIDRFLEDRRESHHGGWAKITPEDVTLLREIVHELIELKCELDADGDLPIEVHLVNRRTHERIHHSAPPYKEQEDYEISHSDLMRVLTGNLMSAASRLDTEVQCESLFRNRPSN